MSMFKSRSSDGDGNDADSDVYSTMEALQTSD
jgi:hypothetical protein